jgi:uncharacterized membrane protein required for colicin V production
MLRGAARHWVPVTTLDWIIVACAFLAAWQGARRGFLVGALSLAGFLGGAMLGARLAPRLLEEGSASPWAPALALGGAVFGGLTCALLLEALGRRLRGTLRLPALGAADALLGALLGTLVALAFAWLAGVLALQTPGLGTLRTEVQRSQILQALTERLPPSGAILRALARFDPLPEIGGPAPGALAAPDREVLGRPGVQAASASTVRILGAACGLGVQGSGWIAAPGVVVTNAHVVAGTGGDLLVESRDGTRRPARATAFDPGDDVAVLAVDDLPGTPLAFAPEREVERSGAILGFPLNGPFDARAARVGAVRNVISQDAYGRGPVRRPMTPIRGLVRQGNSGGPVVDGEGRVLTTVFAGSTEPGARGGFGVPNAEVREALSAAAAGPVSTGPCTT